jgi:GNAT superfamily N-acetyltransferase
MITSAQPAALRRLYPAIDALFRETFGRHALHSQSAIENHGASATVLLTEDGKTVAAAALHRPRYAKTGWDEVYSVATAKEFRRRGFGTALMENVLGQVKTGLWIGPQVDSPAFYRHLENCHRIPDGLDGAAQGRFIWLMAKEPVPEGSYWSEKKSDIVRPL